MGKSLIPNMLTSSNLVFGMFSIISTIEGNLFWGAVFILFALAADGLDGRAARFFGVSSELGKEMDSLCDLVSFGAAPAVLSYRFCLHEFDYIGWAAAVIFALCGAWRLARFNVNASIVHGYFMGLAIPAGGCLVASFIMLCLQLGVTGQEVAGFCGWLYPLLMVVVAFLMVSQVHYPDFKGKSEKMYLLPKLLAVVIFAAVLFLGREAILFALLLAVFGTYACFGILNNLYALAAGR